MHNNRQARQNTVRANKRLIGVRQLSQYLDLSVNTIYSWVYKGKISYIKMGRLLKFDLLLIDKMIEDNTVEQS